MGFAENIQNRSGRAILPSLLQGLISAADFLALAETMICCGIIVLLQKVFFFKFSGPGWLEVFMLFTALLSSFQWENQQDQDAADVKAEIAGAGKKKQNNNQNFSQTLATLPGCFRNALSEPPCMWYIAAVSSRA